ncbi:XrtA/PEP-CTERM system histidine kinase PrsK [Falsiroseomonas tokyonensis]|uniref:histidine kinase n=1 Tax=Falsiroseomonas tokyonensis TaxID=430521 RepID=A0ABV7BMB2_9PROT|nr:XrtA/PEP-CTERM system histidine kinase PrsK [Falsiroseomonas tokyonensis]MBU8536724.1 PEP-CTERM system histidine kinase PrsK [Falsiroseomonas tokyonensis]
MASPWLHAAAAVLCCGWAGLILLCGRGRGGIPHGFPLALACLVAAGWAAAVALQPGLPLDGLAGALEILRSATWLGLLLLLSRRYGGTKAAPLALRFAVLGAAVTLLALAALLPEAPRLPTLGSPGLMARLGLALLVLLVAENLYRNADRALRWHVILPCLTLGGLSALDVVLHADAALHRFYAPALLDARAVLTALAMPLLVLAALRDRRWRRAPAVSRQVVFHGATLVIAGTFLTGVGAVGEGLRHFGADWGGAAQVSLLAGAVLALAVAASSASMRSHLRRHVVDHFFAARFDYRAEWLRCVATLSAQHAEAEQRAIIAVADPVDSPAGLLLLSDAPGGPLRWAGSWNLPAAPLELPPAHPLVAALDEGRQIVTQVPPDLGYELGPLWLAVPLRHHRDGLLGLVLLAPPRARFRLDAEAFDLLRAVGREVAMFLAERRAAERLHDQRALAEHARRFAFVAHDVKNVASQLTMVLANAEQNISDPEFQRDMLLTLGASAQRISALIARLREPEAAQPPTLLAPIETLQTILHEVAHPVELVSDPSETLRIAIPPHNFAAALRHLLDNAIEASPPGVPVRLALRRQDGRMVLDITDRGPGMTAEFIRDRLFRPLVSGRADGHGIGAWQARDLLRDAGGDLLALSTPGAGTTMRLTLPCQTDSHAPRLQEIAA